MNRRECLALVFAAPFALTTRRYGRVDVELAIARGYKPAHVLLDGVDVGHRCTVVDDVRGYVDLHALRDGQPYVDDNYEVVMERHYGRVVYLPHQAQKMSNAECAVANDAWKARDVH